MNTSDRFQQLPDSKHATQVDKARDPPGLASPPPPACGQAAKQPAGSGVKMRAAMGPQAQRGRLGGLGWQAFAHPQELGSLGSQPPGDLERPDVVFDAGPREHERPGRAAHNKIKGTARPLGCALPQDPLTRAATSRSSSPRLSPSSGAPTLLACPSTPIPATSEYGLQPGAQEMWGAPAGVGHDWGKGDEVPRLLPPRGQRAPLTKGSLTTPVGSLPHASLARLSLSWGRGKPVSWQRACHPPWDSRAVLYPQPGRTGLTEQPWPLREQKRRPRSLGPEGPAFGAWTGRPSC